MGSRPRRSAEHPFNPQHSPRRILRSTPFASQKRASLLPLRSRRSVGRDHGNASHPSGQLAWPGFCSVRRLSHLSHHANMARFGKLRLYGTIQVGKDRQSWQELECFLFAEMLICVKEKKSSAQYDESNPTRKTTRCTLKGSILIKKHLDEVSDSGWSKEILSGSTC